MILPGDLKDSSGRTVNPNMQVREAFSDGDHITMGLAPMKHTLVPTIPVGARGRPQMARFTQMAFPKENTNRDEVERMKNEKYIDQVNIKDFAKSKLARKIAVKTAKYRKKQKHNETLAAQFRLVMRNQGLFDNAYDLMSEEERAEELDAIIGKLKLNRNFSDSV